jgi:hypothetical protein
MNDIVPPAQVVDVLGLMGDSVDNIPGVKGIGEPAMVTLPVPAWVASFTVMAEIPGLYRKIASGAVDSVVGGPGLFRSLDAATRAQLERGARLTDLDRRMSRAERAWVQRLAVLDPITIPGPASELFGAMAHTAVGTVVAVGPGRFWRTTAFTSASMRSISSGVTGAPWLKSKRMRSPSTIWPFCVTCVPSTLRSAACSKCVAE